jgi:hypothetical protein
MKLIWLMFSVFLWRKSSHSVASSVLNLKANYDRTLWFTSCSSSCRLLVKIVFHNWKIKLKIVLIPFLFLSRVLTNEWTKKESLNTVGFYTLSFPENGSLLNIFIFNFLKTDLFALKNNQKAEYLLHTLGNDYLSGGSRNVKNKWSNYFDF